MKLKYLLPAASLMAAAFLTACGGEGSASTSTATLSTDQAAYESFTLSPNASYKVDWSFPITTSPISGTHYLASTNATLSASPLTNGPQTITSTALSSIATTLPIPNAANNPTRYLVNGQIVVASGPNHFISKISYLGTGIQEQIMTADGSTVAYTITRSNISVVPLTGTLGSAPNEFKNFFGVFYFNPAAYFSPTATWLPNTSYLKFTTISPDDVYVVNDANTVTTTNTPNPIATGTTLASLMRVGITYTGVSPSVLYTLSNGSISLINGINTYVSTSVITSATSTPSYKTYFELNGNVYSGQLIKAGTVSGGGLNFVGTTANYTINYPNYNIRLNQAAVNSLKAAVNF
ncbi:MAG: hypothetical protein QM533_05400 [Cytophagales bacterium]|nr:hypothetical protein [Cytophagales bacterium]